MRPQRERNTQRISYNPSNSKVLLIGIAKYEDKKIQNIDNIYGNIRNLKKLFCDPEVFGFSPTSVFDFVDLSTEQLKLELHKIVKETRDTLFFYYSGHGFIYNNKFFVSGSNTYSNLLVSTGIEYSIIESIFRDGTHLHRKIVMLDSCYSGNVTNVLSNDSSLLEAEMGRVKGTYILASSPSNRPSKYIKGDKLTEFTKALVDTLESGVESEDEFIGDEVLFREIENRILDAKEYYGEEYRPKQLKTFSGSFYIAKNAGYSKQAEAHESVSKRIIVEKSAPLINFDFLSRKKRRMYESQINYLTEQRDIIQKQKIELTDSIEYAAMIQDAMLPNAEELSSLTKDSFIFFQPRDIVSGDFYWFEKTENFTFIVAADATGHGVPGALTTMLGLAALEDAIKSKGIADTSLILEHIRAYLVERLFKKGERYEGLDMAICRIDKENSIVQYSGAYNPLYVVRNEELLEYKADKFPVGGSYRDERSNQSFTHTDIEYYPNDCFYLFSDGYTDQFGGPRGRKYMYKNFKRLLLQVNSLPMNEQKKTIINEWEKYKGEISQIDDIVIIGFRL